MKLKLEAAWPGITKHSQHMTHREGQRCTSQKSLSSPGESRRDLMRFLCVQGRQSLGCGTFKKESNAAEEASCKLSSSCPILDKPNLIPCGQGGNNNFWKIIRLCLRSQSKRGIVFLLNYILMRRQETAVHENWSWHHSVCPTEIKRSHSLHEPNSW